MNQNEYISALVASGLSIIPITEGEKKPHQVLGAKHDLLTRCATIEEVKKWIARGVTSWGVAGGKVSGNLVTLDFDEKHYPSLYNLWYTKLSSDQKSVVDLCYKNSTRNNGTHLRYRTQTSQQTIKLASRVEINQTTKKEETVTTAETRAEGSYALIPPSSGYTTTQGNLLDIPLVSDEIHAEFIDILRTFNEVEDIPSIEYEWSPADTSDGDRPGDRFNRYATWNEILEPHGWVEDTKNHWRRPGKRKGDGISATTNHESKPILYVFSSSIALFKENKGYSKFKTFAILNFDGDFNAAAKVATRMYPKVPPKTDEEVLSVEAIDEMMQKIPTDTPKVKLMGALRPILENLIGIEKITAETFILNNVKEHFDLTKEDAKKYVQYLKGLRSKQISEYKAAKAKEERLPLIIDRDIDSQEVYDAIAEIGIVNEDTLKIITAVVISAQLRLNPPLWLFLIGVPSSFKTELVGLYSAMNEIYTLDTLTENAFASGYVPPDGSETQDLLPLLDNKAFVIKDLNTLFSMNEEMVKKILGDLTSIFDGKFQKFTATRGLIEYSALFSMIGCVTPSILIKHYNYATALGPRFFFLRLPELTEDEMQVGFEKSWNEANRKGKIIKARQIVSSYCTQLISKIKNHKHQPEAMEIREKINRIALFICKARGIAITRKSTFEDEKGKSVEFYEIIDWQVEQPWRILNQLKHLLRILSFINGSSMVGEEEIRTIRPIILSTMPVDRAEILKILTVKSGISAKEISKEIQKSAKTIQRTMKELEALEITDCCKDPRSYNSGVSPWLHFIRAEFATILDSPIPSPEFLSLSKSLIGEAASDEDEEPEDDTNELPTSVLPTETGSQEVADVTLINDELDF